MLLLADRNFAGYELWGLVTSAGPDMAWRTKKNLVLPPVRTLGDGSFLTVMPTPAENARLGQARARGKPLRAEAAGAAGTDPDRVSFTVTVRVARDHAATTRLADQPQAAATPSPTSSPTCSQPAATASASEPRSHPGTPSRPRNEERRHPPPWPSTRSR
jgi:hypothetical protein